MPLLPVQPLRLSDDALPPEAAPHRLESYVYRLLLLHEGLLVMEQHPAESNPPVLS